MKKTQAESLKSQRASRKTGEIMLQADFAENYGIKYAVEPMEVHWTNVPGVVIFTCLVYYRDENNEVVPRAYGVVSDVKKIQPLRWRFLWKQYL